MRQRPAKRRKAGNEGEGKGRQTGLGGEPMRIALGAGRLGLRKECDAQGRERTGKSCKGEDADDDDDNERAQIAAAEAYKRPETAIARHRHAIAEERASDDRGKGVPGDGVIERGGGRGETCGLGQKRADDADSQDDAPEPEPAFVVAVGGGFDGAEGAEIAQPCSEA
jgi:hypothetical protein